MLRYKYGDIILVASIPDPRGLNPKDRPAVIVSTTVDPSDPDAPIEVVAITTLILLASLSNTTARLSDVSVFKDHGLFGGFGLGLVDFFQYLGPWLLFLHGDGVRRHSPPAAWASTGRS